MRYALLDGLTIIDLENEPGEGRAEVPAEAVCGMLWDGETLSLPVVEPPPAPRRLIRKSTVYDRVKTLGKVPALLALFAAHPQLSYEWNMPGWPNVYADDAQLLAALAAIGCTDAEVAQITAPE